MATAQPRMRIQTLSLPFGMLYHIHSLQVYYGPEEAHVGSL